LSTVLPARLIESLADAPGFDRDAFVAVHEHRDVLVSIHVNERKVADASTAISFPDDVQLASPVPWAKGGWYLTGRPSFTRDPLLHAGAYYVQEASSMFLRHLFDSVAPASSSLKVLDLCAAPGGKSAILQSALPHNSLLVSNEVIKSRVSVLAENMTKWSGQNAVVTNNDPSHFARLDNFFDAIVIDAPCSGSGLFRRDPELVDEWSDQNVALCSGRQQRIISDVLPALKPGGVIIYSTCSYSVEEDEAIVRWMTSLGLEVLEHDVPAEWNIVTSSVEGGSTFRFYPDKVKGEGFFIAALRKPGEWMASSAPRQTRRSALSKQEMEAIAGWVSVEAGDVVGKHEDTLLLMNSALGESLELLKKHLYIRQAGIALGQPAGGSIIPEHALAVSGLVAAGVPSIELDYEQSMGFLRRSDQWTLPPNMSKGWLLLKYHGTPLGWIKSLGNRVNNYYPKEWRVRL
jgi:16S rRNA C967 or C1407 C5-methylase (RsmB/RsmF family)/NOL1/NOP2/fmu family ribosome biogenesis protein